ncbi:hypothetical protein ACFE04_030792 [Oxalis oulophora]
MNNNTITTTDSSSTATFGHRHRNWLELPAEVTSKILFKLSVVDIIESAQHVCPSWKKICNNNSSMWHRIDMTNLRVEDEKKDLDKICRKAIDLSDGQLVDITIEDFANDGLLNYIVERASGLKRLGLLSCLSFTHNGLVKTVAKLPLLEELELTDCRFTRKDIAAVGKACPSLISLKCNEMSSYLMRYDHIALGIAESMPGLRHLQLVRTNLMDYGLRAILNGCPRLESLDLRGSNLCCGDDVKKICIDKIKSFKRPKASMDDYPYAAKFAVNSDDEGEYEDDPCPDICGCCGYSSSDSDDSSAAAYRIAIEYGLI